MIAWRGLAAVFLSLLIATAPALAADVVKPVEIKVQSVAHASELPKPLEFQADVDRLPAQAAVPEIPAVPAIPGEAALAPAAELGAPQAQAGAPLAASEAPAESLGLGERNKELSQELPSRLADPFGSAKHPEATLDAALDAPDSIAQTTIDLDPGRKYHPSPEDWRDEIIYSVVLDRFCRGGNCGAVGDPKDGVSRHGGDLKGLISKLDYIKESGATTILLSPVLLNLPDSYHGYAPIHFMAVDPHLGTMQDMKTLVAEAHKRGIRVIMDWVTNHAGPIFEYKNGSVYLHQRDGPPKEIDKWTASLKPLELARPEHFTRRGVIGDWNDHEQSVNGDFPPNYRHFAADNPSTERLLTYTLKWWMKETDVDGIRLDAIKHFAPGFLPRLVEETRTYARWMGKKNFLIIGENSSGIDAEIASFIGPHGVDSAYNYPAYRRENHALHGKDMTWRLEESFTKNLWAFGAATGMFLRFIDNHDVYRFLRDGEPFAILKVAFAHLMFSMGIPLVYYGTEQAFRQAVDRLDPEGPSLPADPRNREDMFPEGQFKSKSSAGDKFDVNSESFRYFKRLAELRKQFPALRKGDQYYRYSEQGPGISAFSRIYTGQEVLVVMNTANEERSAEMNVDGVLTPAGTALADRLDPSYTVTTHAPPEGGSKVTVSVPPHGVRVFARR